MIVVVLVFISGCISSQANYLTTNATDVQILNHQKTGSTVTGEAKNIGSKRINSVEIIAQFYDKEGNLLGSKNAFVDNLQPGQTGEFDIQGVSGVSYNITVGKEIRPDSYKATS
jgi:hypothetical protein